ncbi:MAG: ABC transporter ATP-binding protein [Calditerrivibrio sp.]|nr:ABC transporter ATP-binding protein [Calditerrivibrio sp.]MCA1932597.1 ABC transporter ATP-binding protein [Calditerrivibrio sp.]MCA1980316.1 ABC transporter ATP-binding protein [Calditerrivibrio sp.]
MSLVKLENIEKTYETAGNYIRVLKNISLSIEKGDFTSLMGQSGSGKTTLMNIIGMLDSPTSGKYYLDGKDISKENDNSLSNLRNRFVGFIFQSFYLIPYSSVLENVLLPIYYSGKDLKQHTELAKNLLGQLGLYDKRNNKPNQLSGGQQQRVAIARALINEPEIILADEPTGQLDSETARDIMEYLTKLNQSGKTILLVTHDHATASYAKKIIKIADGEIVT